MIVALDMIEEKYHSFLLVQNSSESIPEFHLQWEMKISHPALPGENYVFNSLWKLLLSLRQILKGTEDVHKYIKTGM